MSIEIEAKLRLADRETLTARLKALDAQRIGAWIETDVFFDTAGGDLLRADSGLRIRSERPAGGGGRAVLCFKGPRQAGDLKRREELEVAIENPDLAGPLLERLGYRPELAFEKHRERWLVDGCRVEIDRLPALGEFVEIEGPDEASVEAVREKIGLGGEQLVREPYVAMVADWLRQNGRGKRELMFGENAPAGGVND